MPAAEAEAGKAPISIVARGDGFAFDLVEQDAYETAIAPRDVSGLRIDGMEVFRGLPRRQQTFIEPRTLRCATWRGLPHQQSLAPN